MQATVQPNREAIQDVWYGQVVTIVARWFLIAAGVLLTLWRAEDINDVTTPIYLLLGLIAMNFVLHGRFLTGSPMRREVVLASCLVDALIITLVIASSSWKAQSGVDNAFYIFYYPVVLGFALVFPWRLSFLFALEVMGAYAALILLPSPNLEVGDYEALVARLVTIGSTAVLGNMYWRIQRQWRREQVDARSRRR
jgi:hypothetical protein